MKGQFTLKPPVVPEVDLQAAVADALDVLLLPPAMWTALPIGHVLLNRAQAARLARIGTKRGWFDVLVVHGGTPIGIELKRAGGRLSRTRTVRTKRGTVRVLEGQEEVFPRLAAAGVRIATCDSVPAVIAALRAFGVPIRPHAEMAA